MTNPFYEMLKAELDAKLAANRLTLQEARHLAFTRFYGDEHPPAGSSSAVFNLDTFKEITARLAPAKPAPIITTSVYALRREQFRFPTSRKKRIRKKWAKREGNYRQVPCLIKIAAIGTMPERWIVHPQLWEKFRREVGRFDMKELEHDYRCTFGANS